MSPTRAPCALGRDLWRYCRPARSRRAACGPNPKNSQYIVAPRALQRSPVSPAENACPLSASCAALYCRGVLLTWLLAALPASFNPSLLPEAALREEQLHRKLALPLMPLFCASIYSIRSEWSCGQASTQKLRA